MKIANFILHYPRTTELRIDSACKSLRCEVFLEGEDASLRVDVKRYVLQKEEGKMILRLFDIETSRIWLSRMAADHLEGRAFVIPGKYAAAVLKLL